MKLSTKNKKELIDFAIDFSNKYKKLKAGTYFSKNKNFEIRYSTEKEITPAKIGRESGIIVVNKINCKKLNKHQVLYSILWCALTFELKEFNIGIKKEKKVFNLYLKIGRPTISIVNLFKLIHAKQTTLENTIRLHMVKKWHLKVKSNNVKKIR